MEWILLLGITAYLLLSRESKGGKPSKQELEYIQVTDVDGRKVMTYLPEIRGLLAEGLHSKEVTDALVKPDGSVAEITEKGTFVPAEKSAYTLARGYHAAGYNIWVTPTLMNAPAGQKRFLVITTRPELGDPLPPKSHANVALLVSFADPWPGAAEVPPPAPTEAPPIPT